MYLKLGMHIREGKQEYTFIPNSHTINVNRCLKSAMESNRGTNDWYISR